MMIYDIYINSEFINKNDTYYNFTYKLRDNIIANKNEVLKVKIIDFATMNVMRNISSLHDNDNFIVNYLGINYKIYITDGNYTPKSLVEYLNPLLANYNITMKYNSISNFFTFNSTVLNTIIKPMNMKSILGMSENLVFNVINQDINADQNYSDFFKNYTNMLNYQKIILSSSLNHENNPQTNLITSYRGTSGINNILLWVDKDVIPFSTINYTNNDNTNIKLADTNINHITFTIHNEYLELIKDVGPCYIHLQIIKESKYNYIELIYNLVKDLNFYVLLNYFKKK